MPRTTHLKNMLLSGAGTLGSRVLGLVRDQLIAGFFGTGAIASALIFALQVPNLFRRLLGEGALTTALVPVTSEEFKRGGKSAAVHFLNVVLLRASLLMFGITIVSVAAAAAIAAHPDWIAGAFSFFSHELPAEQAERYQTAARLTAVCMPYMPMICLAALFTAGLNLFGRFAITSLSAVWLNVAIIVALGLIGCRVTKDEYELALWVCGGTLVGGFFQLAIPAAAFWREGWRPAFAPVATESWQQLRLMFIPAVAGAGIQQINFFVTRFLAFNVDDRALTVYYLANRVVELPIGVFAVTVSTVIFPAMAMHAAAGQKREIGESFAHGMRLIFAINIPAAVGLIALSEPVVEVLFQHGKFNGVDTLATLPVLWVFALSMPFYGAVALIGRGFSSVKDTRTQSRVAWQVFLLNCALAPLFGRWFGAPGLALANLVGAIFQCVVLAGILFKKEPAFAAESLRKPLRQCIVASLSMGAFAYAGWFVLKNYVVQTGLFSRVFETARALGFNEENIDDFIPGAVGLSLLIPASVALYFFFLGKMRYPEYDFLIGKLLGKLRRKKAGA